jgi:hypothetical protein
MGFYDWTTDEPITEDLLDLMTRQGNIECTSTTRPTSSLWVGMTIKETDTGREMSWTGTGWLQTGSFLPGTPTQTYTPVLAQAGTVGATVNTARYLIEGACVDVWVYLTATAPGLGPNAVTVTLPIAASGLLQPGQIIGSGIYVDAPSTDQWAPSVQLESNRTSVSFATLTAGGVGRLGVDPNVSIATGDEIRFHARYLTA